MKSFIMDLDDCIINTTESAIIKYNYISLQNGLPFITNVWNYNSNDDLGMSSEEFFCDMIVKNSRPMHKAVETAQELAKEYNIVYLTARGHIKNAFELTKESLLKHNFPLVSDDNLIIVDISKSKIDTIKELGLDCIYAADDNAKHIQAYHDSGLFKDLFLMDRPWNRDNKELDKYRIFEIPDILKRLNKNSQRKSYVVTLCENTDFWVYNQKLRYSGIKIISNQPLIGTLVVELNKEELLRIYQSYDIIGVTELIPLTEDLKYRMESLTKDVKINLDDKLDSENE